MWQTISKDLSLFNPHMSHDMEGHLHFLNPLSVVQGEIKPW